MNKKTDSKYIRVRFKTKSVEDWRPIIFPPPGPYWCSGYAGDESYAVIVIFLPRGVNLKKYWPDAFHIESEYCEKIEYSDRFPKPDWFNGKDD